MTDEPKRKTKRGEIGGIQEQRWNHFGSEAEDSEPSGAPESRVSSKPDTQSSRNSDSQISRNVDNQVVHYQESQRAGLPASQITGEQDKQMVSYLRTKKPERKAQIAYLPPALIDRLKRYAFENKREISEVVADSVEKFIEGQPVEVAIPARVVELEMEVQRLTERLDIEERFRTDTEVRHFKKWLRSYDQPQDSDFAKRFMADTRLPQHGSRALYEAKLRSCGYTAEDITLFQEAWKTMLFTAEPDSQPRLKQYINE
jgi:hypothetical protein